MVAMWILIISLGTLNNASLSSWIKLNNSLTLILPENYVCLLHLMHLFKCTSEYFVMEANTMNSDQTAPKRAV